MAVNKAKPDQATLDLDAINAFNARVGLKAGGGVIHLTLPGVCENKKASTFTDEEKIAYMHVIWSRSINTMAQIRHINGDDN